METPKLLKKYVQMILTQQYGITSDKLKHLTHTTPKQSIAELLTTQGLLTKKQFFQVIQEAKQKVHAFKAANKLKAEIPPTKQMPPIFDLPAKILPKEALALKQIGKYEILKKIAQGGMGAVYQARHLELDQIYAIKLILEGAHASPETIARFHREAKISAKLKHPGIVQVVDSGEENGQHYFCMEYVEGESLSAQIEEGLSLNAGIELIRKTLEALEYAHRQGILHRDLKPGNIFVTASGDPKIGDFGLAKDRIPGQQNHQLTQSGEILGTPAYMPPEQASGALDELDESADVYAMGACLYQVMTGRCPFEGKTLHELFYKIISEEAEPPSTWNKKIPPDLDTILLKSLRKERNKRYRTAKAFREELERFQNGYPILARPISAQEKLYKWIKRNRELSIVLGVAFVLILGLISYGLIDKKLTQQKKYNDAYTQALKERKASSTETDHEIRHLLKAIQYYNIALDISATKMVKQEKLEAGEKLIRLACQTGDYKLAEHIAAEIKNLALSRKEKKEDWEQYIQDAKTKRLKEHQARLTYWQKELQNVKIEPRMRENALFEIAKMQEDEIIDTLLAVLNEGLDYFFTRQNPNARQDEYYRTLAEALGKIGNPRANDPLLFALKKMSTKLIQREEKPLDEIYYMVSLTTALVDLKEYQVLPPIHDIRLEMGQNGLYWKNTENLCKELLYRGDSYQKTLRLIKDSFNRGLFKQTYGDLDGAIAEYTKVLLTNSQSSQAYLNRGLAKKDKGDIEGAINDFNQVLLLDSQSWNAYLNRGIAKHSRGNIDEAIDDYTQTISLHPQSSEAFYNRALAKQKKGDFDGAIEDSSQTLILNPQNAEAFYIRASSHHTKKRFDSAIADYSKAIALNPQYFLAYSSRGIAKKDKGNIEGAIDDYNQAISINPQDFISYYQRGRAKENKGDVRGAILDYNQSISSNPRYPPVYKNRGILKQENGDILGAINDFTQAIDLGTKEPHIFFARGLLYVQQRESQKAKQDFIQFLQLSENTTHPQEKKFQETVLKLFPELKK